MPETLSHSLRDDRIQPAGVDPPDDSIDLLRVVAMYTREWRTGLITALVIFLIATIAIVRLPSRYEATVLILPKDTQESPGGTLAALFGGNRAGSTYGTFLASRTLQDDVIRRENLMSVFHTRSAEAARGALAGMTKVIPGGDGTITIQIRNVNAELAARIADAYLQALRSLQESMATSQAEVERRFYEQQLGQEKQALAAAEQDLENTQEGSGVVQMDTQTQIGLNAIANIRAEITGLQVRLAALLQSATEQNPQVQTLRSQLAQLQAKERALESGASGGGVGAAAPAGKMPRVNLAYTRKLREVRLHEAQVNSLATHYEDLRLSAGVLGDNFEVIDRAVVPEQPTWPPRRSFFYLAFGASLLAGLLAMTLRIVGRRIAADPVQRAYVREIADSVRVRR